MSTTVEDIRAALSRVLDPALQQDLVTAGMVKSVALGSGAARIDVRLTTPACPQKAAIHDAVVAAVRVLPGIESVDVQLSSEVVTRPSVNSNPRLPGVK